MYRRSSKPLAETHPELAAELHPTKNGEWGAQNISAGSDRKLMWICSTISDSPCENEWIAVVGSRARGNGCPACSNKAVHSDGRNSMSITHPDLAVELHPIKNGSLEAKA